MNDTALVALIDSPCCNATAVVYQWPDLRAGTIACTACHESANCAHETTHAEFNVQVCDLCNCTVAIDDSNPEIDRAEYIADQQIMAALGK